MIPKHFLVLLGCLPVPMNAKAALEPLELALQGHCPVTLAAKPTCATCVVPGSKVMNLDRRVAS